MSESTTSPNRGTKDLSLIRGNSFKGPSFTITNTDTGDPIPIAAAFCSIMRGSQVIHQFSPAVSGVGSNIVTLSNIARAQTIAFPVAVCDYDLELDLVSGETVTYIGGKFTIYKDSTYRG